MTISVGMIFPTIAQNIPSYLPSNGLVGWWPFNGNANDESGNLHNGVVNGATLASDRNKNLNSAYSFNGLSSFISCANPDFLASKNLTISFWVIITNKTSSSAQYLISKGNDASGGFYFSFYNNPPNFYGGFGPGASNVVGDVNPNAQTAPQTEWSHICFVYTGTEMKLYKNNTLIEIQPYTSGVFDKTNFLVFGKQNYSNYEYYSNCILDDIAIHNRALTQEEITKLYTATPPCTNPIATITPQGNTTFCQGGFVNLNASTGSNYTYQWYNNGQTINGVTNATYQATASGSYSVKVMDGTCNATSNATTVVVNQYPSSNVQVVGNTTICQGSSVTLSAQGSGTYLWSNGATSQSITVNQTGSYSLAVTQNGCTSNSTATAITVNPNPTASITPQGNTTFCQGGFVNLVANGGTSYQWNTGSSNSSISANQSGTYTVNVFNSFGCQATANQVVVVNANPNVTINNFNSVIYKTSSAIQLQGSPDGGTFSGEGVVGSTFNPLNVKLGAKAITYNYTSPQGCSGVASRAFVLADTVGNVCNITKYDTITTTVTKYDTVKVNKTIYDTVTITNNVTKYDTVSILKINVQLTTGVKANQLAMVTAFPNPTSDVLVLEVSDIQAFAGYKYKMLDIQGKEVYVSSITIAKTEISLKSLGAKGVYVLHILDANNTSIENKKIVLE